MPNKNYKNDQTARVLKPFSPEEWKVSYRKHFTENYLGALMPNRERQIDEIKYAQAFEKATSFEKPVKGPINTAGLKNYEKTEYEIYIRSFADSNGDGIGDFRGITENVDYLKELGVTRVWMMPWVAAASWHKYDALDLFAVDPEYGTIAEFKEMCQTLHANGIAVDMDLVPNHCSNYSYIFARFIEANLYPTDENKKFKEMFRYIPHQITNMRGWHHLPLGHEGYYYATFYDGMPDYKAENLDLQKYLMSVVIYWKSLGVDGFRLDAVRHIFDYIFHNNEIPGKTSDEKREMSLDWLIRFTNAIETLYPNTMMVGESNEDLNEKLKELMPAFSEFSFPWLVQLTNAIRAGSILTENHDIATYFLQNFREWKQINPHFLPFNLLSNHDRERIRNRLSVYDDGSHETRLFAAANLLFVLPGIPVVYYGDELGMTGPTPSPEISAPDTMYRLAFPWDKNGHSKYYTKWVNKPLLGSPGTQYRTFQPHNLEEQRADPNSLFNHYRKLIQMKKNYGEMLYNHIDKAIVFQTENQSSTNQIFGMQYNYQNTKYILAVNISDEEVRQNNGFQISADGSYEIDWSAGKVIDNGSNFWNLSPGAIAIFKEKNSK